MHLHIRAIEPRAPVGNPIVPISAGDVPTPLLLATAASGEDAIRIDLRIPTFGVVERREARTGKSVLIDRAIAIGKIVARDHPEGAFFIGYLQP